MGKLISQSFTEVTKRMPRVFGALEKFIHMKHDLTKRSRASLIEKLDKILIRGEDHHFQQTLLQPGSDASPGPVHVHCCSLWVCHDGNTGLSKSITLTVLPHQKTSWAG